VTILLGEKDILFNFLMNGQQCP